MSESSPAPPDTDGFESRGSPHEEFAKPTVQDREISQNNFGAGQYKSSEVYEQTQRFKKTLNAQASVGQSIERLARGEVFKTLARSGWKVSVEQDDEGHEIPAYNESEGTKYEQLAKRAADEADTSRDVEAEYGRLVFDTLPEYLQMHAITELSTLDSPFDPPEMRVTKFFHEATRSKGARLMDNVFGRVKKLISEGDDKAKKRNNRLFGGRNR